MIFEKEIDLNSGITVSCFRINRVECDFVGKTMMCFIEIFKDIDACNSGKASIEKKVFDFELDHNDLNEFKNVSDKTIIEYLYNRINERL
jgi:hypothetical protein